MTLFEDLKWRGLIKDISSPDLEEKLNKGGMTFYIGTDPTADSMHIGHYSSFSVARRLKEAGHHPILLVGGATGLIGDPKPTTERPMITKELLSTYYEKLSKQVKDKKIEIDLDNGVTENYKLFRYIDPETNEETNILGEDKIIVPKKK